MSIENEYISAEPHGVDPERTTHSRKRIWIALGIAAILIAVILAILLITRDGSDPKASKVDAENSDTGTVKFLMEQQWMVRLKLAKAEEQTVARQITSVGRVIPAANSQAVVSTPVSGVLGDRPLPQIGQYVAGGQPLAVVRQTATASEDAQTRAAVAQTELQRVQTEAQNTQIEIENARLEADRRDVAGDVETARIRLDQARREANRERQLYEVNVVSQRDMQTAESERDSAQASYDAAVRRLAALNAAKPVLPGRIKSAGSMGISPSGSLTISAPFGGYVTKVHKSIGEQVSPGDAIIEISNLDTVYVEAPIFERDLSLLGASRTATFTTAAYPTPFKGTVLDIGATIDELTRAATVLFVVENAGRALRLGMQANVQLDAEQSVTAMMVPKEAVLEHEGKRIVYVLLSGEEFQRREVTVGDEYGEKIAVLTGLEAGERVVTQGAYQLKLQELNPADAGEHSHET